MAGECGDAAGQQRRGPFASNWAACRAAMHIALSPAFLGTVKKWVRGLTIKLFFHHGRPCTARSGAGRHRPRLGIRIRMRRSWPTRRAWPGGHAPVQGGLLSEFSGRNEKHRPGLPFPLDFFSCARMEELFCKLQELITDENGPRHEEALGVITESEYSKTAAHSVPREGNVHWGGECIGRRENLGRSQAGTALTTSSTCPFISSPGGSR